MKKCKNFLVTLIKLASSDPQTASMASNVRGLVRALLVCFLSSVDTILHCVHQLMMVIVGWLSLSTIKGHNTSIFEVL